MDNLQNTEKWVGSWSVSPVDYSSAPLHFNNQTLRAKIKLSIGGKKIRLKFSNRFGHQPVSLSGADVAIAYENRNISEGTNRKVTFDGEQSIVMQPLQNEVYSDEIDLETTNLESVAISLFFSGNTSIATAYLGSSECCTSVQGDYSSSFSFPINLESTETSLDPALPLLTGIDVLTSNDFTSVVTFGDSITAMDWPDYFADRLVKESKPVGVLRQGIGGNKVLNDSPYSYKYGIAGIKRFKQDAIHSCSDFVIVLHGVNDIIHSCGPEPISEPVSAEEIINGLRNYIKTAHEEDKKIFGATIMPFGEYRGITSLEENKRQTVNEWIRTSGEFDGIIDFDKATEDPDNPGKLLPEYDSGDHLHPSKNGAKAMADYIDLSLFCLNAQK